MTDNEASLAMLYIGDRLADPRVQEFFSLNKNKASATRGILELLGVPLPQWAQRSPSGRAAVAKAAVDRFRADHPQERLRR